MNRGERLYRLLLLGGAVIAATGIAAVAVPSLVYDQFLWKYFVGPVVADAANQATAVFHGVVAHRGYTLVSEGVYGLTAVYALAVLVELLRRYGIGTSPGFVLWFVPFIVAGGMARVVEDAAVLSGPAQYLFISPVIYGTVFVVAGGVLAAGTVLDRRGVVQDYRYVIGGGGMLAALGVAALLLAAESVAAAWMLPASLGLTAALTAGAASVAWYGQEVWAGLNGVLNLEGGTVLAGHILDGSATALSIAVLGYGEKHPVTEYIMEVTGTPYSFPVVKSAVILVVLGLMHGAEREEDPLFYNLVLLGILAVGLGPAVRNLARAVFGV